MVSLLHLLLYMLTLGGFGIGVFIVRMAETSTHSAIHEIEGLICLLIGTVALGSATVVATLEKNYLQR